ncbi:MAG TPA: right-handed parallel beta-helix repeat-containing protein [Tepidisphaeraceae bacterium]|jgi:hypothetical protein|nr:right-handed parallel beta-helix repeat-containing protein [Tepidisphaeraceae bacterium]
MRRLVIILAMASAIALRAGAAIYWVDQKNPMADDRAAGSQGQPFKTISRAAKELRAGDHVFVRPGIYRESVAVRRSGTKELPIGFVAEKPGTVIVTGADVLKDFQRVAGDAPIYGIAWAPVFAIDYQNGKPIEHHPQGAPLWGRAEQIIVDDRQFLPVASEKDLRDAWAKQGDAKTVAAPLPNLGGPFVGCFFADTSKHELLWLADGSDPNQHLALGSTRKQIFGISEFDGAGGVAFVQARGFIFRYAANFPQRAAVTLYGHDNLIEDCVIESMSGAGVYVNGTLRTSTLRNNGHIGGSAGGDGFLNEQCLWEGNSWKPISRSWEAGGAKNVLDHGGTFRQCLFRRNGGPGLWLDIDCKDILITECVFDENEKSGLFIEISREITATRNLARNNAVGVVGQSEKEDWSNSGITLAESENCLVAFNTAIGNRDGLSIREQGPRDIKTRDGKTIDYHNMGHVLSRNKLISNRNHALAFWYDNDFFGRTKSPSENLYDPAKQNLTITGNTYESAGKTPVMYGVPWRDRSRGFKSVSEFHPATGFETDQTPTDAGWSGAPADIEQWLRNFLPAWQR